MSLLAKVQVLVPSTTNVSNVTFHGTFSENFSNATDSFKLIQPKTGKRGSVLIISKTEKDEKGQPLIRKINMTEELTAYHKAGLFTTAHLGEVFVYEGLTKDGATVFTVSHKAGGAGEDFGTEKFIAPAMTIADYEKTATI